MFHIVRHVENMEFREPLQRSDPNRRLPESEGRTGTLR
jgi:hypothetical protein